LLGQSDPHFWSKGAVDPTFRIATALSAHQA
jgi:hypothetical protein